MSLRINNSSVLSSLIGLLLLMTGFVGFMAYTFSKSTAELEGVKLVETCNIEKQLDDYHKICVVTDILADDAFEMPDNHQKAIKGRIFLCAIWPDSTQNILIDWNKKSQYMRIHGASGNSHIYVNPRNIECSSDTTTIANLKLTKTHNNLEVKYFNYKFNLTGTYTKGEPRIMLQRECLADSSKVAITMMKNNSRNKDQNIEAVNVAPYDIARSRQNSMTNTKTIYIIISVIGVLMFFIPERQAINTIESTRNIVNKIINDIKD